jgi:hypothetical protein
VPLLFWEQESALKLPPFTTPNPYELVFSNEQTVKEVRDHLAAIADTFWMRRDVKWAFPYVYALVTNEVLRQSKLGKFRSNQILHWVANFYQLYVWNLNSFLQTQKAEQHWVAAFTVPFGLRAEPWGAQSAFGFIVGMFAHIALDLPRALALTHLKFAARERYSTAKDDFDILNTVVFPTAMREVAKGGTEMVPGSIRLLPEGIGDWLLSSYSRETLGLEKLRDLAWKYGNGLSWNSKLREEVVRMPVVRKVMVPWLR